MMHDALMVLAGFAYGAAAFRSAYVITRARRNYGVSDSLFLSCFFGLLWPATLMMVGLIIGMSGDAGVFGAKLTSEEGKQAP